MNTNIIKNIVIFTVGASIGALATVMVIRRKYEEIIQEEISSVREYSERRRGPGRGRKANGNMFDEKGDLTELVRKYNGGDVEAAQAMMDDVEIKVEKNYHEYEEMSLNANNGNKDIYVITTEEFSTERPEYDKLDLSYYEDDKILADEDEAVISNVEAMVGDALDRFGEGSDDAEIVYVRNERMAIDFQIIRLSKGYADTVGY